MDNPFGSNAATGNYYQTLGLAGHPGRDYSVPYGSPIPCAVNGSVVSAILSENNPNLMAYRAVNTIFDDANGVSYEIQYGHCSAISAVVGQTLNAGEDVAAVGNTGDVFQGGVEITEAEKLAGSHAGSHLHFQVRVLARQDALSANNPGMHYLNDGTKELVLNGFKYAVPNWNNGYNGCVDPTPFFTDPNDLSATIKAEVQVLNTTTDPTIKQSFIALIIAQVRKLLGF